MINPDKQIAEWAAIKYTSNHIIDYVKLDEEHAIFEVPVPKDWEGKSIGRMNIRKKYGINILAVKENGKMNYTVVPENILTCDKSILVLGELKAVQKCFHIWLSVIAFAEKTSYQSIIELKEERNAMANIFLGLIVLITLIAGYFAVTRLDRFVNDNIDDSNDQ